VNETFKSKNTRKDVGTDTSESLFWKYFSKRVWQKFHNSQTHADNTLQQFTVDTHACVSSRYHTGRSSNGKKEANGGREKAVDQCGGR